MLTASGDLIGPWSLLVVVGSVLNDQVARRFGAHRSVACTMAAGMACGLLPGTNASFMQVTAVLVVTEVRAGVTTSARLTRCPSGRSASHSTTTARLRDRARPCNRYRSWTGHADQIVASGPGPDNGTEVWFAGDIATEGVAAVPRGLPWRYVVWTKR